MAKEIKIGGINFSHERLVELAKLADQAKPFFDWVEVKFRESMKREGSLNSLIGAATKDELRAAISHCYSSRVAGTTPLLADGVGKSYPHSKACYYFFAWLIRDAPQQRLAGMIGKAAKKEAVSRKHMEMTVLAALIAEYKGTVKTFEWAAVREIIIDRLEGSRRSLKGHEKEAIARTALLTAIQRYFAKHKSYGVFDNVEIPEKQISVGGETYDVSAALKNEEGKLISRILVPVKTRETEGGGHAHLYTRDVGQAFQAAKSGGNNDYLVTIIVAREWDARERDKMLAFVDHLTYLDMSPTEFKSLDEKSQADLDRFVSSVLSGELKPKGPPENAVE